MQGTGGGGGQVEARDRGAGRASFAAAAGSNRGAQASGSPQLPTRGGTGIRVRHRYTGGAVVACSRLRTATRTCRDKLRQAQDLLRHRTPDGDLATIFETALDLLIEHVKKERFATGRTARQGSTEGTGESCSRHIPDSIKRAVFERDGGRCTFTDEHGRRCAETGALEFDHRDGFARTHLHRADRIRLLCRAHNQHAAEQMYGRAFMERARESVDRLEAGTPSG